MRTIRENHVYGQPASPRTSLFGIAFLVTLPRASILLRDPVSPLLIHHRLPAGLLLNLLPDA